MRQEECTFVAHNRPMAPVVQTTYIIDSNNPHCLQLMTPLPLSNDFELSKLPMTNYSSGPD
jgi:hypothetical protein